MKRSFAIIGLLLLPVFLFASSGDFCGIDNKPGTTAPCDVKGGAFSEDEIREIVKKDSTTLEEVYKEIKDGKVHLYLFYSYDCPHCKKAHAFLEEVKKQYPQLQVYQYEIKKNRDNVKIFETVAKQYDVRPQGVPTIFLGNKNFVGFNELPG
jgi:thiol-disulfide isomerase/thioredoxin